jgi:glycosyltransferase involved in cell wall biosynthesis
MHKKTLPSRLFIQADNIHSGGGSVLLKSLIESKSAALSYLQVDTRMNIDGAHSTQIINKVSPNIFSRFKSQYWLWSKVASGDTVLCFGNLPPLFKLQGTVLVFVQNKYIIDDIPLKNFPLKIKMRLVLERFWFRHRSKFANEFIVQTPSMKVAIELFFKKNKMQEVHSPKVRVLPLVGKSLNKQSNPLFFNSPTSGVFDFVYPASGEPHKNHQMLIDAFVILAKEGIFPTLAVTVDEARYPKVSLYLKIEADKFKLNITNLGFLDHQQLATLYGEASCLLYPSLYESFGIPLIEAKQFGLFVIASELDYVRDSISPDYSFDPKSATSIARAIKRYLGVETAVSELFDGETFLQKLIKTTN